MSTAMDSPRRHRYTVDAYYRMAEAAILRPDEHVELIDGEIIDVPPPGSLHAGTIDHIAEILRAAVGRSALIRVQNPIRLDDYSEPQPDIALLQRRADFYKSAHPSPTDVLLIVEVAHSSLGYDREVKVPLYARHCICEVWLLELENRALTRYRNAQQGRYQSVERPLLDCPLDIEAIPGSPIDFSRLLAD